MVSLSDEPVVTGEDDRLHRDHVRKLVFGAVMDAVAHPQGVVVALSGPWGSGKTSMIGWVLEDLQKSSTKCEVVSFRPWIYADYQTLFVGFFEALLGVLPRRLRWKSRASLGRAVKMLAPAGKATTPLFGADSSGLLKNIGEAIEGKSDVSSRRKNVDKRIGGNKKAILVVIDDLDRLMPSELLLMFKLMREIADYANVTYLLAFDYKSVLESVRQTELGHQDSRRASEYLEKMIQLRLDLPPMHELSHQTWFESGLRAVSKFGEVDLTEQQISTIYRQYRSDMARWLSTPRAIRKFFRQLAVSYPPMHGEVEFGDFFRLTFIRVFEPTLYEALCLARERLTGSLGFKWKPSIKAEEDAEFWNKQFNDLEIYAPDREYLQAIVKSVFPRFMRTNQDSNSDELTSAQRRRARSGMYFDRYFQLGLLPGDVSDVALSKALLEITRGGAAEDGSLAWFDSEMDSNPVSLLEKIDLIAPTVELGNAGSLVEKLCIMHTKLSDSRPVLGRSDKRQAGWTIWQLLDLAPESEAVDIVNTVLLGAHPRLFADILVDVVRKRNYEPKAWATGNLTPTVSFIRKVLEDPTNDSISGIDDSDFHLIFCWAILATKEEVRNWLWFQVTSGRWELVPLLGKLVGTKEILGVPGERVFYVGSTSRDELAELLPLDEVLSTLGSKLDRDFQPLSSFEYTKASPAAQEEYALTLLAHAAREANN